jgi:phage/plasmid-associated DNA primase
MTRNSGDYYNIWKGFARTPKQGNCIKYWDHVRDNICNGDEINYRYLRRWLAYVFQRPHVVHTAIVLQGSQGVGKNSFVEPLGVLFGSHYTPLSGIAELISNFNYHLKNAVLIHANEALWGDSHKNIGTLKAMITEELCLIESKGKDRIKVRNFKHVIFSSNEDLPVHMDKDDRRFAVFMVADHQKENHEYFKEIRDELEQGGYEALLYDLLHEDLTGFDPRKIPMTNSSFEIKMRSAQSSHRYLYEVLSSGGFTIGIENSNEATVWQSVIEKSLVYNDYSTWCINNGELAQANTLFSKALNKVIVSVTDIRPSGNSRARCYKFATLRQSQIDFAKSFKVDPSQIFENYSEDDVHEVVQYDEF